MNPPTGVALVGYGLAGRVFHAPLITHTPGLHLHAVVSSDPARVHADLPQVQVLADPAEAFADPQIGLVVIAAPNAVHAPLAIAALRAGRHVLVDKPLATSLDEARRIVAAATDAGRIVSVFHNRRYDADFLCLRGLVARGALGELAELHSHFDRYRPEVPERWRERPGPGAGLWMDLGPHLVDQALELLGMPLAVQADIAAQREGAQVDDFFHVLLRYRRARAVLHAGSLVLGAGLRFAAHGARGSYLKHGLDPQEAALRAGQPPGGEGWGEDPRPGMLVTPEAGEQIAAGPPGDYPACYAAMRDAMLGLGPPPVGVSQALAVMQVLDAARESAASGRTIALSAPPAPAAGRG